MFNAIKNLFSGKKSQQLIQPLQAENERPVPQSHATFVDANGVKHELYAIFEHPDWGSDWDMRSVAECKLQVGATYAVASMAVGNFSSHCLLKGCNREFNSVHFRFVDEARQPVNVTQIPEFQTYFCFSN